MKSLDEFWDSGHADFGNEVRGLLGRFVAFADEISSPHITYLTYTRSRDRNMRTNRKSEYAWSRGRTTTTRTAV